MSDLKDRPGNCVSFRFVTDPVYGYEKWTEGNRPFRIPVGGQFPARNDWRKLRDKDGNSTPFEEAAKEFSAAGVFIPEENLVQVFSWSQKNFNKRLTAKIGRKADLSSLLFTVTRINSKPVDYDLDVERAEPYTPEQEAAIAAVLDSWTGPEALLENGDPFAPFGEGTTKKPENDADIPF
jgi:hypothetical protein